MKGHDEYVLEPWAPLELHHYANDRRTLASSPNETKPKRCKLTGGHFDPLQPEEATCLVAGDETPADRKVLVAQITAQTAGPLFLYVNDAALPLFNKMGLFYPNNHGCAQVTVQQVVDERNRQWVGQSTACSKSMSTNAVVSGSHAAR
ncbi:hypothetical protein [Caballeronia humi]|uniref:Uncharacterized protein n=1 Tax=Caballeronia humi TaxID=326474 RepID=A0A158IPG4_9BURK|nr:hypothetical protein [Caballeronia humi]SAL57960.1 hypothetical protein AWB65_05114 [Caballeronia humi]